MHFFWGIVYLGYFSLMSNARNVKWSNREGNENHKQRHGYLLISARYLHHGEPADARRKTQEDPRHQGTMQGKALQCMHVAPFPGNGVPLQP